jgi:hypothetical protein
MRLAVILIVVAATAGTALADGRAAERAFTDGEAAYKSGRFIDAAKQFEAAYAELPAAEIAFSAAQAYRLGYQKDPDPAHVKRAIELYEVYLRDSSDGARVADASAHLESLKKEWRDLVVAGKAKDDRIAADKTQIGVIVPARVRAAKVMVDGKDVSGSEYVDVEPGDRVVRVEADGYLPYEEKVPVARGAQLLVRAELDPRPARVTVKTEGGARISVDGRTVSPRGGVFEAAPGKHYVTITRRGHRPFAKEIELEPGGAFALDAPLRSTDQRRIARFALVGTGVLVGLAGVSATLAFIADSKASGRADDGIVTDADADYYNRWRDRRNTARTATFVVGGAAVLAGVATLGLYLFDNPAAEAPPLTGDGDGTKFTPMMWGDGLGIGVEGGW